MAPESTDMSYIAPDHESTDMRYIAHESTDTRYIARENTDMSHIVPLPYPPLGHDHFTEFRDGTHSDLSCQVRLTVRGKRIYMMSSDAMLRLPF